MGRWLCLALLILSGAGSASAQGNYTLFESGPVRPLALSPDGSLLFACNIPDARLEIFSVSGAGLAHVASVPVGLEPVAVAARSNTEVWVVNQLSDSISIVDVPTRRVTRTLLVGDEPRDIVFAGTSKSRAFITAAHRGQNRPGDPQLLAGGVGRSDVWVFDATSLGAALGGTPLTILSLGGDTPRALAATPNGATVYAAVFHSGDQTTILPAGILPNVDTGDPNDPNDPKGALPMPAPVGGTLPRPAAGVMLKYQSGTTWLDTNGTPHTGNVQFSLPDHDVFAIDAKATTPVQTSVFDHVGTILFNMVVYQADPNSPSPPVVYVSNTDANNMDRFEGFGPVNLRGELHKARISILSGTSTVTTRHLNKHIDYAPAVAPLAVNQASLGIPTEMAITSDGRTLYLAAFGSQEIGIIDTAALALPPDDPNSFTPNAANHIPLSAGGPGGVVLDESHNRLYVYTRFDDGISLVDPTAKAEVGHLTVHSPEVAAITQGRRFLYDTHLTSSNGEAACAVCHVFGDFDSLAWDLGSPSPDGSVLLNNNPFVKITNTNLAIVGPVVNVNHIPSNVDFHPLKGPMTTQTLRGMEHDGPMHWRGDRSGGGFSDRGTAFDGDPNALDENQGFLKFNVAFVGLLGRASQLSNADMQAFANFILKLQMPPNPIRNFDQTLTASQAAGQTFYSDPNQLSDTLKNCNGCHTLDQSKGAFGTGGLSTFEGLPQHFKVPQLRNMYQKVGMFGMPTTGGIPAHGNPTTEQVRGFGYLNDGSVDTVVSFLNGGVFAFPSDPNDSTSPFYGNAGSVMRTNVANFLMAFPSDLAPIVGQQVTLTSTNSSDPAVTGRLGLLIARALTPYVDVDRSPNNECDLVVKGEIGGVTRGWWLSAADTFTPDKSTDPVLSDAGLRALAAVPGQELTYTCAPPGSGQRMGIDRGGVGDSSQPDGIRDAEQCGDVTGDGIAAGADVAAERAFLAGASTPVAAAKCNVAGPSGSGAGTCTILDVTVLRRAVANLAPGLSAGCNG
jgi:YVTN family beta-propeller protein